jgi:hypothetical protein
MVDKADRFKVIGSPEEWMLSVVFDAMKTLYRISKDSNLETAIRAGRMKAKEQYEQEQIALLAVFYRKEMSGDLKPPPSLELLYEEIIEELLAA